MNEQVSISFTILPDGSKTACVSVMPFIDGQLAPEQVKSAIVGNHNVDAISESEFVNAISDVVAKFRSIKGI